MGVLTKHLIHIHSACHEYFKNILERYLCLESRMKVFVFRAHQQCFHKEQESDSFLLVKTNVMIKFDKITRFLVATERECFIILP